MVCKSLLSTYLAEHQDPHDLIRKLLDQYNEL